MKYLVSALVGGASFFGAAYFIFRPKKDRQKDVKNVRDKVSGAYKSARSYVRNLGHTENTDTGKKQATATA